MTRFEKRIKLLFLISISIVWFLMTVFLIIFDFKNNYKNYEAIAQSSLNDKRALITGRDFYQFLMFCNRLIPEEKGIRWLFPEGRFLGNDEYLFYKAYYYLYPRNYRDNADYIVVYDRQGFKPPPDYKVFAVYGIRGYILKK